MQVSEDMIPDDAADFLDYEFARHQVATGPTNYYAAASSFSASENLVTGQAETKVDFSEGAGVEASAPISASGGGAGEV